MALLDILVVIIVGVAAIGGFMRGLVQEVLSLAAWMMAAFSVHFLHPPITATLRSVYNVDPGTPLLSFAVLLLIPYAAMKVIAGTVSGVSEGAILGPIDRVLGFGFGAIKGALIAVFAFSVLVLGFDDGWGYKGRPNWITTARTYAAADAFSRQLLPVIAFRREQLRLESEARDAALRAAS
jgi:membrane protein required for colicin V production